MESTIISILIAVAIIAFQAYSEKKKRDQKRASASSGNNPLKDDRITLSSLFEEIIKDEIPLFSKEEEYQDPYTSILEESLEYPVKSEPSVEVKEYKFSESNIAEEGNYEQYKPEGEEDIYDSKEISEHNYDDSTAERANLFGEGFDPRLFII